MKYIRSIKFHQKPDYCFLKDLFIDYMKEQAMEIDFYNFDWIARKEQIIIEKKHKIEEEKAREEAKKMTKAEKKKP
jgi:hypothetical protein